jgi:hypothetical protein
MTMCPANRLPFTSILVSSDDDGDLGPAGQTPSSRRFFDSNGHPEYQQLLFSAHAFT